MDWRIASYETQFGVERLDGSDGHITVFFFNIYIYIDRYIQQLLSIGFLGLHSAASNNYLLVS